MNRNQYIDTLQKRISCLPDEYSMEILDYYKEHFEEGILLGRIESEIAKELGSIDIVANSIIAEYYITNTNEVNNLKTFSKSLKSIANIGIGTLNIFTASIYTTVLGITIPSLYLGSIIMLAVPPAAFILHLINPELPISFGVDFVGFELLVAMLLTLIGWKCFKLLNKFSPKLISRAYSLIIQKNSVSKIKC